MIFVQLIIPDFSKLLVNEIGNNNLELTVLAVGSPHTSQHSAARNNVKWCHYCRHVQIVYPKIWL